MSEKLPVGAVAPLYTYTQIRPSGVVDEPLSVLQPSANHIEQTAGIIAAHEQSTRDQVIQALGQQSHELNNQRVNHFFRALRLPVGAQVLVSDIHAPSFVASLRAVRGKPAAFEDLEAKPTNAPVFSKDELNTAYTGCACSEHATTAMEEAAHVFAVAGLSGVRHYVFSQDEARHFKYDVTRVGFLTSLAKENEINGKGAFFEQGFKALVTATYRQAIDATDSQPRRVPGYTTVLPTKYSELTATRTEYITYSAGLAAVSLELLASKNPDLLPALLASRSTIEGLREVPRIINGISPGLYRELRDVPAGANCDYDGLRLVIEKVFEGNYGHTLRTGQRNSQEFFGGVLAQYEQATGYDFKTGVLTPPPTPQKPLFQRLIAKLKPAAE